MRYGNNQRAALKNNADLQLFSREIGNQGLEERPKKALPCDQKYFGRCSFVAVAELKHVMRNHSSLSLRAARVSLTICLKKASALLHRAEVGSVAPARLHRAAGSPVTTHGAGSDVHVHVGILRSIARPGAGLTWSEHARGGCS